MGFIDSITNSLDETVKNITGVDPKEKQQVNDKIISMQTSNILDNTILGKIINTISGAKNTIGETNSNETIGNKIINSINSIEKGIEETKNNIKDKVESLINNTPSDQQNAEFKDDTNQMILDFMKGQEETRQKELQEAYAREDAIRKETQEREDTAYQRAVEDMRKAGINPNLVGISPSASGGGITSASRTEQVLGNEINAYTSILNSLISKDTTMSEGEKDRITNLISSASQMLVMLKMFGGK